MYRLFIYHRHCTRAGQVTNEAQGDDTYELTGTAADLRRYAECGLEAQSKKPMDSDRVYLEYVYRNILDELEHAALEHYAAPVYTTSYHGAPYGEAGEAGPNTDKPRALAEGTLHNSGQYLIAVAPDGSRTQFRYVGASALRVEEIELPD